MAEEEKAAPYSKAREVAQRIAEVVDEHDIKGPEARANVMLMALPLVCGTHGLSYLAATFKPLFSRQR
jgi:hypothetical protein